MLGPMAYEEHGDAAALQELDRRLTDWQPDLVGTLMFLQVHGRVLLIRKRRGHGAGKINGPGGKPEPGETPLDCVVRETVEETGVRPLDATLAAVFRFLDTEDQDWLGYIFRAGRCTGSPATTAEAIPEWRDAAALPFDEMWDDDRYWLPRVLRGERLYGDFLFTAGRLRAHRLHALGPDEAFPAGSA